MTPSSEIPILEVEQLRLSLAPAHRKQPRLDLLHDVSLTLHAGETLGLVGESGAGKSITALAIAGLLPSAIEVTGGRIRFEGEDLLSYSERQLRQLRGSRIASVFQEPASALNPALTIGYQVAETIRTHGASSRRGPGKREKTSAREVRELAIRWLERVSIADARNRFQAYPHQLSGGQRQRVVLAMALAAEPDLLIADEPTTALDVTVQRQILDLIADLRDDLNLSVLLITHDLAVIAEICDRVAVMYAGRIVEEAPVRTLLDQAAHPYTQALLASTLGLVVGETSGPLPTVPGKVPSPSELPEGCAFHPRCAQVRETCREAVPSAVSLRPDHRVRCILHREPSEPGS